MAKISNIFKEETRKADLHPKRVTHWIHYTKLKDNPAQYRYGKTVQEREELKVEIRRKEEALADLIEADGEVIQDLLVRKIDTMNMKSLPDIIEETPVRFWWKNDTRKAMPCFLVLSGIFRMYDLNLPAIPPMDMQQKRIMKLCVNWKG